MDTNTIVNGIYHSATLGGLVFANCIIAKKVLNVKPAQLGTFDIMDYGRLTVNIYAAMMTQKLLIKNGILPENITPPPA